MNRMPLTCLLLLVAGCSGPAPFSVAESREKPVIPEEQVVFDYLVEVMGKGNFRIEKWGPHLFNVGYPDAGDPHDITVFTSKDDERPTASAIRVRFERIDRKAGRTTPDDWIVVVRDGKQFSMIVGASDTWTEPYLAYQRSSGKRPRPTGK